MKRSRKSPFQFTYFIYLCLRDNKLNLRYYFLYILRCKGTYKFWNNIEFNKKLNVLKLDELNKNIVKLNNGKYHQPIFKVRIKEAASKFNIGEKGNKQSKFVEAADGTNLFFCIFENENKERTFLTLPLRFVINCQKKYRNKWRQSIILYLKENKLIKENLKLQFILSPNDFVYLPTKEQLEEGVKNIDRKRLFVVNDFNDATIYFRPHTFSKAIFEKEIDMRYDAKKKKVLGSFSQKTANYDDMSIKDVCLPIKVDRLGNIIELDCIS